ncbi:hypothetical protein [Amycolatopsis sp. cg9]|uniref:hypothetical protein n=1 Tax=Amycolatopsis sp. cg9 TaxID=3238801 RepID=UPI00352392D7
MPDPADAKTTLDVLLSASTAREDTVIRGVALRAGLLRLHGCGWYNPGSAERCENCRTRVLPDTEPETIPALGMVAVRDYLTEAHGDADGPAQFVAACRAGICGGLAFNVADDVLAGAQHYGYGRAWPVIAAEIIAGVEARAQADGSPRVAPAAAS